MRAVLDDSLYRRSECPGSNHVRSYVMVINSCTALLGRLRSNLVSQSAVPWEVPNHDIMLTEWPAWVDEPLNG